MKKKYYLLILLSAWLMSANAQWNSITSPYTGNLWNISFADATNGYIGGNTAILNTSDGGVSWTSTPTGTIFSINDFSWVSATTGYYAANNNIVGKTTDGGVTWTSLNPNASPYAITTVSFVNNTGYAGGNSGVLRKTLDAGSTWTTLSASLGTSGVQEIHFFDATTGILCAEGGKIKRTTNGGASWSTITSFTLNNLYDMFFVDNNVGFIVGANGYILKTVNAGANWSSLSSGTTEWLYAVCFKDANNGYAAGANRTILKTIDGGITWAVEVPPIFPTSAINDMVYANNRFYAVADQGQIISTNSSVGIDDADIKINVSVSPNPFSDKAVFRINNIPFIKDFSLILYSALGEEVKRIEEIQSEEIWLGRESLPSGIYFYKLSGQGMLSSGKIIMN